MLRVAFALFALLCVATAFVAAGGAFYFFAGGSEVVVSPVQRPVGKQALTQSVKKAPAIEVAVEPEAVATPGKLGPVAEAPEKKYDFGVMDPFQEGRHTFVLYNRGDEPLVLKQGATSCKCTLSDLPENTIPPGDAGRVTLEWQTHKVRDLFANSAEILTNDPKRPAIVFEIEGKVRHQVRTLPEAALFGSIEPGATASGTFLVYSQTWNDMRLDELSASLPGVELTTRPATPEELASHDAKSGMHVDVVLPADLPKGDFYERVTFNAVPSDGSSAGQHYEVALGGKVTRSLCLYGLPFVMGNDILNLGTCHQGQRKEWVGILKVRGPVKTVEFLGVDATPADLKFELEPMTKEGQPMEGTYRIRVILPEDAGRGAYTGPTMGRVAIQTDHPTEPSLEFHVNITILSSTTE